MVPPLTLDRLRRMQRTLSRRVANRDPENIISVGFSPESQAPASSDLPIIAQFDVVRKLRQVPRARKIAPIEEVRLLDRSAQRFDDIALATDVNPVGRVVPCGVGISHAQDNATTSLVLRWTRSEPHPPIPSSDEVGLDPGGWQWGVLTVSHLFARHDHSAISKPFARVRRNARCGVGPLAIAGRLVIRGRMPGGPDLAVVETGLDRLWLSGFLPRIALEPIPVANERDLIRWISHGTSGRFVGDNVAHSWRWSTFYPELSIDGLGKLQSIVRYEYDEPRAAPSTLRPFGPGASGGVVMAGGIPIGMHVAAMLPDFRVGYAQTFWASLPWLKKQLQATHVAIVHVVTSPAN